MQATGLLFLSKTRPTIKSATDGTFSVLIYAYDRIVQHQVESWLVLWSGEDAKAFWESNQPNLRPGTAIEVNAMRMRAHVQGRAVPEIHAVASSIKVVSTPDIRAHQQQQSDQVRNEYRFQTAGA